MAEREVLERDASSPGGEGTQEGPARGRKKHRHPRGTATWFASESLRVTEPRCNFRPGKPSGIIDRDRAGHGLEMGVAHASGAALAGRVMSVPTGYSRNSGDPEVAASYGASLGCRPRLAD
jgi:hypothetical protein